MIYYFTFAIIFYVNILLVMSFLDHNAVIRYENITTKTHNPDTEICCNGLIHKKISSSQDCCRSSIYDTSNEACCNGEKYNRATHTCCKNIDRGYFYTDMYMSDFKVVDGITKKFCCGDKTVENEYKQLCCGGIIYPNDDMKLDCCGMTQPYDSSKDSEQICCPETKTIINKTNNYDNDCCNGKSYNTTYQVCCRKMEIIIDKENVNDNDCCNGISFNYYKQQCCEDTLLDLNDNTRCCNGKPFNTDTEICCYDEIMKKTTPDDLCCNYKLYNSKSEICCNDTIHLKDTGVCCFYEWQEIFYEIPNATIDQCCGFDLLSATDVGTPKEYCCKHGYQERMYEETEKKFDCCGFTPYDFNTEICCGESIISKSKNGESSCCTFTFTMDEYINKTLEL